MTYKQQEQAIMAKLDRVEKHLEKGKKGSIGDAADQNDAIRLWVSVKKLTNLQEDQTWSHEKLQERLETSIDKGMTSIKAEVKFKEFGPNELTER